MGAPGRCFTRKQGKGMRCMNKVKQEKRRRKLWRIYFECNVTATRVHAPRLKPLGALHAEPKPIQRLRAAARRWNSPPRKQCWTRR